MSLSSFLRARFARSKASAPPAQSLNADLARLLTTEAPNPELFTQALELIAKRTKFAACTLVRLHVSPTQAYPPRLVPYVTCPRHPLDRPEQSPRLFELAHAQWLRRAIESATTIVVRQDKPAERMDAAERAILGWDAFHSVCLVPLVVEKQALGVLACCESHPWSRAQITPQRIGVLENAACLLALALTRLYAEERTGRYTDEFQWLAETMTAMEKIPEVEARAQFAMERVCVHFRPTQATLYLLRPDLVNASCWIGSAELLPRLLTDAERVRAREDDVIGRVLETRQTECATTPVSDAGSSPKEGGAQTRATVPLKTEGQALGALQVTRPQADPFDPLDIETLEALAGKLAASIAAVRAQGTIRSSTADLQTLQRLSRDITTSLDVEEVCRAVYRGAREVMDCDVFYVALYDDQTKEVEYVLRVDNGDLLPTLRTSVQDSLLDNVLRQGRPVLVPEVEQEPRFSVWHWGGPFRARSLICVPLPLGDGVLGAVSAQSSRRDAYTDANLEILATLASQAAVAINHARLYADSQRQKRQLLMLNEIGRIVTSTIEINPLLEMIGEQMQRALRADTYYVALSDPVEQTLTLEILVDGGIRYPRVRLPSDQGLPSAVLERRAPLLVRDLERDLATLSIKPHLVGQARPSQSWLGVPMLTPEHAIGVLAVGGYEKEAFDESDQATLQNIASQVAMAVDNARHHAQVEEQARRDSLTQAFNHSYFLAQLRQSVERGVQTHASLTLIMLGVDYFQAYNDHYGHLAVDAMLRGVMAAIQPHIRPPDLVGRWSGEVFAIALLDTGRDNAYTIAHRIRRTLSQMKLRDEQGRPVPVPTISQGLAVQPEDACEPTALIDLADRRLRTAKDRGGDQVEGGEWRVVG